MFAMARSVTKSLPATLATSSLPFLISVRNDVTVMPPLGKKRAAASFKV
jgi:hypothetical protein